MSPANPSPTPFDELNAVLTELVRQATSVLGENLVGAYLQGSFALGDSDSCSDVDFLVALHHDIGGSDLSRLQAIHDSIYESQHSSWARHLEGSYAPAAILRRWSETPRDPPGQPPRPPTWSDPGTGLNSPRVYPYLFLEHGGHTLVRSEHDNTRVVRWIAREKGITLVGPPPANLIDPVSAEDLRTEMHEVIDTLATTWMASPERMTRRWLTDFFVVLYCRMLHTLETGGVASKKAGIVWAQSNLEAHWHPLIERAWQARFTPEQWLEPADPADVSDAVNFMEYVTDLSRSNGHRVEAGTLNGETRHADRQRGQ